MNKLLLTAVPLAVFLSATAQQNVLTAKDYERAESRLSYGTAPYIDGGNIRPNWLANGRFWYRALTPDGSAFFVVDPERKTKSAAFDQEKLAASLSSATGKQYKASMLPFYSFRYSDDSKAIIFRADDQQWKCDLSNYTVTRDNSKDAGREENSGNFGRRRGVQLAVPSPDGTKEAYIKDWNLWVRDLATGKTTQLTTDGVKNYGYATDNAGWKSSDGPVLRWSPDSKKIATFKDDQREVGNMYLVTTNVGHPTLKEWKYPLPGDKVIPMIER
ncbi:MAG: DPP IV N-terminal domain-containing protein, partial [Bacteroidetes bacterium]|nr:DPP IV N-terminal domain-containing protein [Bacteroidota bacterium]